jgi:tetratricopeptide (TPR) repeat protein
VELQERLQAESHTRLRHFCSPHHQDSPLHPIISQLQRAAGFRHDDTDELRLHKLTAMLARATDDLTEATQLIANLLSVPTGDRYPPLDLTPQKRKEKTLRTLLGQLEGFAAREPALVVFEDIHWIDPTSLELLELIVDRVPSLPILLIITFRPEFAPPWVGRPHVALITLTRLPPRERAEMIAEVTSGKALPREIVDQIVDRTDGVPLFIEELTKSVVESGILVETGDRYALTGPVPLSIPSTLQASLHARLDRRPAARKVAQIGSALGRSFSHELVTAVAQMPQSRVDDALAQLVSAELIFRRGSPPNAEYTFKHALVQEVTYGTLQRTQRRLLHARIVEAIERLHRDRLGEHVERLAHHAVHAELLEKAVHYSRQAGLKAAARWALQDARNWFDQALTILGKLPESRVTLEQGFDIRLELRPVLSQAADARQVLRLLLEAEALAERLGDRARIARVSTFMTSVYGLIGELDKALAIGTRALSIARDMSDTELRILTTMHLEQVHFFRGEFRRVVELARENLAASASLPVSSNMGASAPPSAFDRFFLAQSLAQLGRFSEVAEVNAEAMRAAAQGTQIITVGIACHGAASAAILRGDWAEAQAIIERWMPVARSGDLPIQLVAATAHAACVSAYLGNAHEALERYALGKELIERLLAKGPSALHGFIDFLLACTALRLGNLGEARQLCERAAQLRDSAGYAMCLHGDIATHPDGFDPARAESYFRRALSLAEPNGMRPLQSLSQLGLGRLYRRIGRLEDARTALSQSVKMLHAMEMTFWLSEAEAELLKIA